MRRLIAFLRARPRVLVALQVAFVVALLAFLGYAVRDAWEDAWPRLQRADPAQLALAFAALTAYYLLFVVGWLRILAGFGIRISYNLGLQAEMASMLAKYVPGGVWTPAARVLWLRRAGVGNAPLVLASILLEAGLSAIAGVVVFVVSLAWAGDVDAPLLPLLAFAALVALAVHPRVFRRLAVLLFRRFGVEDVPLLRWRVLVGLLVYYSFTWLVGGAALYFLVRSVGGDPGPEAIPFLGGISAVGAIVAVLSIIAPSGLGVREGAMYGLMLAVVTEGVALGATLLNRVAITVVEALLLLGGVLVLRMRPAPR